MTTAVNSSVMTDPQETETIPLKPAAPARFTSHFRGVDEIRR